MELQDFNKSADLDNSIDAISPKPSRVPLKIKHVPTEGDNKSSTIKTVITIFISFVGAGILGLPYAFLRSGYVMGTVCIAAVSIISLHCMLLLLECKHRLEDRGVSTYSEVPSSPCLPCPSAMRTVGR